MIEVKNLVKRYGDFAAVDDISFTIPKGQTFGLLGPNGAGKTTTIHTILGVHKPETGSVSINGQPDPTQPALRKLIGAAPQALALYEELTGEENVRFFGQLYGLSGKTLKKRVEESLEFVGLLERRSDRAHSYSGGMKRRLNMACALVHDPEVIVLDEPTVGVDPQSRNSLFDNIEELKRRGRTILYTTHYMEEAQRLCEQVAIMDRGKLLAVDTVDNLIDGHGGVSVVELELETIPENFDPFPGQLHDRTLRIETEAPLQEIARLIESGLRFSKFKVEGANLETVFLNLTGRSLRDT